MSLYLHDDTRPQRRLDALRKLDLVRCFNDVQDDERIKKVIIAHVGDGLDVVECWVVLDESLDLRLIDVDGDLQVAPDRGMFIEDLNVSDDRVSDAVLAAMFHRSVKHVWIGVDE